MTLKIKCILYNLIWLLESLISSLRNDAFKKIPTLVLFGDNDWMAFKECDSVIESIRRDGRNISHVKVSCAGKFEIVILVYVINFYILCVKGTTYI